MWMKTEPHGRGIWYLVYTDDIAEYLSPPPPPTNLLPWGTDTNA